MVISQTFFPVFHLFWRLCDRMVPKRADCWAFATHHLHSDRFIENQRAVFEQVKADLESEEVDGRTFWFAPTATPRATRTAYLLPAWDEFTVGYRDRSDILDPKYATRVNAGGGVLKPVVVIGGRVVGTWQRTIAKGEVAVTPTWFTRLDRAATEAFDAAVDRYAGFLALGAVSRR